MHTWKDHKEAVKSIAVSPDGKYVVSGSWDGDINIYSLQDFSIEGVCKGHEGWINSVAFSLDGQFIVSASGDGTIRLWDLKGQSIGDPLLGHGGWISEIKFSSDGSRIISSGNDGTIRLWDVPTAEAQGKRLATNELGAWQDFLEVACDRLCDHPILTKPNTGEAKIAQRICKKRIWKSFSSNEMSR